MTKRLYCPRCKSNHLAAYVHCWFGYDGLYLEDPKDIPEQPSETTTVRCEDCGWIGIVYGLKTIKETQ